MSTTLTTNTEPVSAPASGEVEDVTEIPQVIRVLARILVSQALAEAGLVVPANDNIQPLWLSSACPA